MMYRSRMPSKWLAVNTGLFVYVPCSIILGCFPAMIYHARMPSEWLAVNVDLFLHVPISIFVGCIPTTIYHSRVFSKRHVVSPAIQHSICKACSKTFWQQSVRQFSHTNRGHMLVRKYTHAQCVAKHHIRMHTGENHAHVRCVAKHHLRDHTGEKPYTSTGCSKTPSEETYRWITMHMYSV